MNLGNKPMALNEKLMNELRQGYGLGASFFRAVATRIEMTDTDIQVIDLLENMGEATAGQLADLMGLTTGTFTAILNRLVKAGLVQRERDPNDGRRVIVKIATDDKGNLAIGPLFASLGKAWEEMAENYTDEQKALLLEFLERSNALAREEIGRLREVLADNEGVFSSPLADAERAQLAFHAEGTQLNLRVGQLGRALYEARFEGPMPDVKVKDGVLTIRYPRRSWLPTTEKREAEVTLNSSIAWQIGLKGGGSNMTAELGGLDLLELEANGAGSGFKIDLPEPMRVVPIQLGGSGSEFNVQRPAGVAARVQLKGWGSGVFFDGETVSGTSLQSSNYEGSALRYDIETSGSGSMITVTSG